MLNRSVNQTLSRTILTHGTVFLACVALDLLGGPVIRPFALAMTIGIVVGTYSSIYIAAPMLLWLDAWNRKREATPRTRPESAGSQQARERASRRPRA